MPEKMEELKRQLASLQEQNHQLKATCESLEETQASLVQVISESNDKLLRSEMTSMELEQVFSACTDALWVIREDGVVVRANDAMLALLGKSAAEVIGQQCSTLLDYTLCQESICPIKRARSNTRREYDIQLAHIGDGNQHFILSTAPLITLDGRPGIVGQFKDITSRKEAETELAAANKALEQMARIDSLTQIANRRCFDETLQREWQRSSREQKPLSLLLGDIDFFKKYNDHYGHQAGDECLRQVGKALAEAILRPADLVARYGGEEFVILLPDIDLPGALHVGERILTAIKQLEIEHQPSTANEFVTMSIGAATLIPNPDQNCEELTKLADEALYRSKEGGRDRITPAQKNLPDSHNITSVST